MNKDHRDNKDLSFNGVDASLESRDACICIIVKSALDAFVELVRILKA